MMQSYYYIRGWPEAKTSRNENDPECKINELLGAFLLMSSPPLSAEWV
jgi:hypothetical protein